jgi:hypothetical protein
VIRSELGQCLLELGDACSVGGSSEHLGDVLSMGHWLEVFRVDAHADAARVVCGLAAEWCAVLRFEAQPVDLEGSSCEAHLGVAAFALVLPDPAACVLLDHAGLVTALVGLAQVGPLVDEQGECELLGEPGRTQRFGCWLALV